MSACLLRTYVHWSIVPSSEDPPVLSFPSDLCPLTLQVHLFPPLLKIHIFPHCQGPKHWSSVIEYLDPHPGPRNISVFHVTAAAL